MTVASNSLARHALVALALFAAFTLLGMYVSTRTPVRIDVEAVALRGQATGLALFFTALGRWYALLPIGLAALGLAWRYHLVHAVTVVLVTQVLSQAAVSLVKPLFHRHRPDYWLIHDELGFSYPSGHVVTTVVFYLGLLYVVSRAPSLPRPLAMGAIVVLGVLACGIPWSRLALGAHYPTDVIGGAFFGLGCAALALAFL